ncbi:hypothetical protein QYF36_012906 [Acer negundo]|nr:hypothetical protein QYF36_012906 [Acer negundo]
MGFKGIETVQSFNRIQNRVLVENSGVNVTGPERVRKGTLISQVEDQTDLGGKLKEDTIGDQKNILSTSSGLWSSQKIRLEGKGPSEVSLIKKKKFVVEGKASSGPDLKGSVSPLIKLDYEIKMNGPSVEKDPVEDMAMVCSSQLVVLLSSKKSNPRNWKRMVREKKVKLNSNQ